MWSRVVRRPSVCLSVCLSVIRPSVVNFSHFRLLLWNRLTEFNETWQEGRTQHPLPSLCFSDRSENKVAALASDWLKHVRLLWNCWTEFNETWREARSQCPLPSLCFFGPIGKTRRPPLHLIGWDIFDFSSETAERNSRKLDRKQDLNVLYQFCVFRANRKNKMAAIASDWLNIFDFSSETAEQNSTILDRKQDLNVLYQVCDFRSDRKKNKMAAIASDWLRHFQLLLWNHWT